MKCQCKKCNCWIDKPSLSICGVCNNGDCVSQDDRPLNALRHGVPLVDTGYELASLKDMTKRELIEEILGTHDWDYLLELGMVVEVKA